MAHFAEIDGNNIVLRVVVIPDEQEHRGEEFLRDDLKLGGRWIQTSYNNKIRRRYAGEGYIYDEINDVFLRPQPATWFVLDQNFDWICPIGIKPENGEIVTAEEWGWLEVVYGLVNNGAQND